MKIIKMGLFFYNSMGKILVYSKKKNPAIFKITRSYCLVVGCLPHVGTSRIILFDLISQLSHKDII